MCHCEVGGLASVLDAGTIASAVAIAGTPVAGAGTAPGTAVAAFGTAAGTAVAVFGTAAGTGVAVSGTAAGTLAGTLAAFGAGATCNGGGCTWLS